MVEIRPPDASGQFVFLAFKTEPPAPCRADQCETSPMRDTSRHMNEGRCGQAIGSRHIHPRIY